MTRDDAALFFVLVSVLILALAFQPPSGESVCLSKPYSDGQSGIVWQHGKALIDINTADQTLLETLPGIGESLAQRIILERRSNGSYETVEALVRVSGIGPAKVKALSALVTAGP